jgi:hypothetical protein
MGHKFTPEDALMGNRADAGPEGKPSRFCGVPTKKSAGLASLFVFAFLSAPAFAAKPVLDPIGDKTVDELVLLTFAATDTDVPADTLTFSLDGTEPAGETITVTVGEFDADTLFSVEIGYELIRGLSITRDYESGEFSNRNIGFRLDLDDN